MDFEWDPKKAEANLRKHGIEFRRAVDIFAGHFLDSDRGEQKRWKAVGVLDGTIIAVISTQRVQKARIISARKARRHERNMVRRSLLDPIVNDRTDWERLRNMTEEEIEANALSDPDNPPMTEEELARMQPRVGVSVHLHPDVAAYFEKTGPLHFRAINDVLEEYVRARTAAEAERAEAA